MSIGRRRLPTALACAAGLIALVACARAPDRTSDLEPTAPVRNAVPANTTALPITLDIFAAASLTAAFDEIGDGFAAEHAGVTPRFNFAGSQQLATQINEGAPADVFASANNRQMDVVIKSGEVVSGTGRTFARNRLVVVHPADNPAGLRELADLAGPDLKIVLASKAVPAGGYALEFLAKASAHPDFTAAYSATVMGNVVSFEEDVERVLGRVALGEADAGIVYVSDLSGPLAGRVGRIEIPDDLNVVANYPIAPLARSAHPELARAFVDFVLSPGGQAVLAKHGFVTASGDSDVNGAPGR